MRRRSYGRDFQGLGVYQQVARAHNPAFGTNYERYNPGNVFGDDFTSQEANSYWGDIWSGIPGTANALPDFSVFLQAVSYRGLQRVDPQLKDQALTALSFLTFNPNGQTTGITVTGEASYVAFSMPTGWAESYILQGYVLLVSTVNISDGMAAIIFTKDPATIASHARVGSDSVIVDGPQALIDQAAAALTVPGGGAVVPVPGGTTPGGVSPGAMIPGGQAAVEPAKKPLPDWVVPVAIGGAVLAVTVGVVLYSRSKRSY